MQRIQTNNNSGEKTKIIVTTPKSQCSIRTIPIPDELIDLIKNSNMSVSGYFLTGSSKKWIEPRTMQTFQKQYQENVILKKSIFMHCVILLQPAV